MTDLSTLMFSSSLLYLLLYSLWVYYWYIVFCMFAFKSFNSLCRAFFLARCCLILSSLSLLIRRLSPWSNSRFCSESRALYISRFRKSRSCSTSASRLLLSFVLLIVSLVISTSWLSLFLTSSLCTLFCNSRSLSFSEYSQFSRIFRSSISKRAWEYFSWRMAFSVLIFMRSDSMS